LFFYLTLYPASDFPSLEAPRPTDLETGDFPISNQPVGSLLVDLEKFRYLTDGQNFVGHARPESKPRGNYKEN
jgi:hypothetical protein